MARSRDLGYFVHSRLKTPSEREDFCREFKYTHKDFEKFVTGTPTIYSLNFLNSVAKYFGVSKEDLVYYKNDDLYSEVKPFELFSGAEPSDLYKCYAIVVDKLRDHISDQRTLDDILDHIVRYRYYPDY